MSFVIKIDIRNFDKIKETFRRSPIKMATELSRAVGRIILRIESDAKREAPVGKRSGGSLRQSISSKMLGIAKGQVRVGSGYGIFVHEGTRPHIIRIRNKKVLADRRSNRIFGKIVQHPGTKANPFLKRAVDKNNLLINKEFEKAIERVLK